MPSPLSFSIKPLTPELARRTLFAHTVRGILLHLTSPASLQFARHRLDFVMVLGLSPHVRWYSSHTRHSAKPRNTEAKIILQIASTHWQRSLHAIDLNSIELALCSLADTQLVEAMTMIDRCSQLTHLSPSLTFHERNSLMLPAPQTSAIPTDILDKLTMNLASLEQSLLAKDAMMPVHLRSTHSLLITYPETVHLLDDSEIALIIDAAEMHTKTEIVKAGSTKSAGAGSRKKLGAADL